MRWAIVLALLAGGAEAAYAQNVPGALSATEAALQRGEWPAYAGSNGAQRWSPLDKIDRTNAAKLQVIWRGNSPSTGTTPSSNEKGRAALGGAPGAARPSGSGGGVRTGS